ncbi:CARDB domain-containing protein, partial [Chloroflexota bacterium]
MAIPELLMMLEVDNPVAVAANITTIVDGINTDLVNQKTIFMRTDLPPFDDIRVAQALAMAIDRQDIIDTLGITVNFYDVGQYEYNPEKAVNILMECGYPTGFATEIVCEADHVAVLNEVQDYWADIGVVLTIQEEDTATWKSTWENKTWGQMIMADNEFQLVPITIGGAGATSIWTAVSPPGMSPCYAFLNVDGSFYLVGSLTESALEATIDTLNNPGNSLALNSDYQTMLGGLPVSKMSLGYVDIQQVLGMLPMLTTMMAPEQNTGGGGGEADALQELLPIMLGPLRSMGMSLAMDAEGISGTMILHVEKVDSRVFIDPAQVETITGDSFTMDICVDEVWTDELSDLYSVECHLAFDPSQLEVEDADGIAGNGVQITPNLPEGTYSIEMNLANNAEGTIDYVITLLDPLPAFPPTVTLATITFNCKNAGTSGVLFLNPVVNEPPVKLADSTTAPIPVIWFGGGVRQYPPSGRISGHVYQSVDGTTPIEGARIDVYDYDSLGGEWHHRGWTRTDSGGYYIVRNLHERSYGVRVQADGYISEWYPGTYYWDLADPVEVTWPNETTDVDFTLDIGGSISGRVTSLEDGMPIANCDVDAVDPETHDGMGGTRTDWDGYYTILGLPTGSHKVRICARNSGYVGEWYNDKPNSDWADSVPVAAEVDTPDIDFVLEPTVRRAEIADAIKDGVAWLAAQQNGDDGSWGAEYPVAKTALAVLKLETHAIDLGYASPFDTGYLYHTHVQSGLDYLFANAEITGISMQSANDPDTNNNGTGVYFRSPVGGTEIYETGEVMMAIAGSTTPARVVNVADSPVDGWTYSQVLQDTVDYIAWAQTDSGFGRGGWNYNKMDNRGDRSDQSISGWATLGLAYAEDFGSSIPGFVRTELDIWIDYIQDDVDGDDSDGGSWYTGPGDPDQHHDPPTNFLRTGNLLQQMAFVGDTPATPRVQDAIDYLVRHWDRGWGGCPTNYQTTYIVMKGLEALSVDTIDSINWFGDFTDALLSQQAADGWWPHTSYDDLEPTLSTEWAMLTLQKVIPPPIEKPDLIVIDKWEVWIEPGVYRVHCTLENIGNLPITEPNHFVTLFINGVLEEARNVPLEDFTPGNTLPIVFEGPFTLTIGDDEVEVYADTNPLDPLFDNVIDELNELNNCHINHQPALPDLTVVEKHEQEGDQGTYRVFFEVRNSGNVIIPAGHYVSLVVDGDPIEQKEIRQPLAPGETYPGGFSAVIPLTDVSDEVTVCADSHPLDAELDNVINEVDEENNCLTNTWPPRPDLVISEKHEEWGVEEQSYIVYYQVRNRGNDLAAAGFGVSLRIDGDLKEVKEVPVALGPGEKYIDAFETTVLLSDGADTVLVGADHNNEVDELDESNNFRSNDLVWPPAADLEVYKHEEWVVKGQSYIVHYKVLNLGNVPAEPGFDVSLWIDEDLEEVKEVTVALGPGEVYGDTFTKTILLSDGADTVEVHADHNNEVVELDESNNSRSNDFVWLPTPVADAGGPYDGFEGSEIIFDASASSDPDGDPLWYRWDFDNDGNWDTDWSTDPTETHTWFDDYTGTVKLQVSDGALTATATDTVTVHNVPPWITITGDTIDENGVATVTGPMSDPGADDELRVDIDWGDGFSDTFYYPAGATSFSETHQYLDGTSTGTFDVTAIVDDGSGVTGSGNATVTVNNVAPTATIPTSVIIYENMWATVSGTITDPGTEDTFTMDVNWGDGFTESINLGGTRIFTVSHPYLDDNPSGTPTDDYNISLTVTDDDGGEGTATAIVTVNNVNPDLGDITATIDPVEVGTPVTASASFTDVGTLDTHTALWDWGDGTSVGTITDGIVSNDHPYTAAGVYTVTLTVTDDDGGEDVSTFEFVVVYDPDGGFVTGGGWIDSP